MYIDLIEQYSITAKQIQPEGATKEIGLKLTTMTMVDPAIGWFEIVEVPYCNIVNVKNDEQAYIDKNSARISRIFIKLA